MSYTGAGKKFMDVVTYTGNGGTQSVGGLDFSPGLVWIKARDNNTSHGLFDTVRGAGMGLYSDSTSAEFDVITTVSSFNSDGFTLGSNDTYNTISEYVAWCWNAGDETVTNNDGTITSTVRANQDAGFSVVSYSYGGGGGTWGHGLNDAPSLVIVKNTSSSVDWCVWHEAIAATDYLMLNQTTSAQTFNVWQDQSPTSSVVSVSNDSFTGTAGDTYIAYCWSEVPGYSKFSSYTGGTSSAPPFVYTGFKPRWIMMKASSVAGSWVMYDTQRDPDGTGEGWLYANSSSTEQPAATYAIETFSNGFRMVGDSPENNGSGITYIFMAFAETPLKPAQKKRLTFSTSQDFDEILTDDVLTQYPNATASGTVTSKDKEAGTVDVYTNGLTSNFLANSNQTTTKPVTDPSSKRWTWTAWVKRSGLDSAQKMFSSDSLDIAFGTDNNLFVGTTPFTYYYFVGTPSNLNDVLTNGVLYTGQNIATTQNLVMVHTGGVVRSGPAFLTNGGFYFGLESGRPGGFYTEDGTRLGGSGTYSDTNWDDMIFTTRDQQPDYDQSYAIYTDSEVSYVLMGNYNSTSAQPGQPGIGGLLTTETFADASVWMHVLVSCDTVSSEGYKLYVNGDQITSFDVEIQPGRNSTVGINATGIQEYLGKELSGYLADLQFVDGQALTPSDFLSTSEAREGQVVPTRYAGWYGTRGYRLPVYGQTFESSAIANVGSITGPNYTSLITQTGSFATGPTESTIRSIFDGDDSVTQQIFRGAAGLILTSAFENVTRVRVCCYKYSTWNYFKINDQSASVVGEETTSDTLRTWMDVSVPADGIVNSIEFGYTAEANYYCCGIEINGVLLTDDFVSSVLTLTDNENLDKFVVGDVVQSNSDWNQSQIWSDAITSGGSMVSPVVPQYDTRYLSNAFSGNYGSGYENAALPESGGTWTFRPSGFGNAKKVSVWVECGAAGIRVNGSYLPAAGMETPTVVDVTGTGLQEIEWYFIDGATKYANVYGIAVDDILLVNSDINDPDVAVITDIDEFAPSITTDGGSWSGTDTASTRYEPAQVWSNNTIGTFAADAPATNCFDGSSTTTGGGNYANGAYERVGFTFSPSLTGTTVFTVGTTVNAFEQIWINGTNPLPSAVTDNGNSTLSVTVTETVNTFEVTGPYLRMVVNGGKTLIDKSDTFVTSPIKYLTDVNDRNQMVWGVTNIDTSDAGVDTPNNYGDENGLGGEVRGNYATLNPLDGSPTLTNGNLTSANADAYPTLFPGYGTWYYEVDGVGYTWDGQRSTYVPRAGTHNFGATPFVNPAAIGDKTLNTTNLETPLIPVGNTQMGVVTYTGTGADQTISGLSFSPDLVWVKARSSVENNILVDTVRGAGNRLISDGTYSEVLDTNTVSAFTGDGFVVGNSSAVNGNAIDYVSWCWNAGDTTSLNTSGTVASQVRANPLAGFSIVTATLGAGEDVGHGLGVTPSMVFAKTRDQAANWYVQFPGLMDGGRTLYLNATDGDTPDATWATPAVTSSVLKVNSQNVSGLSSPSDWVFYCWSEVPGFSKFGSYSGVANGSGFVHLGFEARWIMIKRTDSGSSGSWYIWDTERDTDGVHGKFIQANLTSTESDGTYFYTTSTGFKHTDNFVDQTGATYIYAAFAEMPTQFLPQ